MGDCRRQRYSWSQSAAGGLCCNSPGIDSWDITIRYQTLSDGRCALGAFAPNHALRKLVVKAGASAPRRRKDRRTDTVAAPLGGVEAQLRSQLQDNKATSGRLSWAAAMKACWKVTSNQRFASQHVEPKVRELTRRARGAQSSTSQQCECGGKRSLVALIQQPAVITKVAPEVRKPTRRTKGAQANTAHI